METNEKDLTNAVGTTVPHEREQSKNDTVMVSFRLDKAVKDEVAEAANNHGRTMTKQFIQSLVDGLKLQGLIAEVNDHLTETIEVNGKQFVYKPNEDNCIEFIVSATRLVIDKENREKREAE